eukprot:EG_transcript_17847
MDQTTAFSFLDEVSHEARKPLAGDGLSARERDMANRGTSWRKGLSTFMAQDDDFCLGMDDNRWMRNALHRVKPKSPKGTLELGPAQTWLPADSGRHPSATGGFVVLGKSRPVVFKGLRAALEEDDDTTPPQPSSFMFSQGGKSTSVLSMRPAKGPQNPAYRTPIFGE